MMKLTHPIATVKCRNGTEIPCRVFESGYLGGLWDWSAAPLVTPEDMLGWHTSPTTKDRRAWLNVQIAWNRNHASKMAALLHEYEGQEAGKTALLCAPGASLTEPEGMELLDRWRRALGDNGKVVAMNLAAKLVRDPDYLSFIDPHGPDKGPDEWLEEVDRSTVKVIAPVCMSGQIIRQFKPEQCRFYWTLDCGESGLRVNERIGAIASSISVVIPTIHALAVLGFTRIICFGIDLGALVTGENEATFYGDGRKFNETWPGEEVSTEVIGLDGRKYRITPTLFGQRLAMTCQCAIAWDAGVSVYHARPAGVLDLPIAGQPDSGTTDGNGQQPAHSNAGQALSDDDRRGLARAA